MTLGQDTGKNPEEIRIEFRKLMKIISESEPDRLPDHELNFYHDMRNKAIFPSFTPSGKQLFWLRDIKDKLL